MNEKIFLGLDVGEKGFAATQHQGELGFFSFVNHSIQELNEYFKNLKSKNCAITCVIEDVHALYNSSAKATFNFGFNKGYLVGLLVANKIPYTLVPAKEWQSCIWTNADKEYDYKFVKDKKGNETTKKTVNTKKTSINAAKRLFPDTDLRRSSACKNIDDNKVDALLMSEYARRKNL